MFNARPVTGQREHFFTPSHLCNVYNECAAKVVATKLTAIDGGVGLGLLATAFTLGLRHGFDWDHIAAIGDLSGTAENRRRGFWLAMLYAVGHAIVVFALGVVAIGFGLAIPDGLDVWMGRVVGVTLVLLGVWILVELIRKGRNFRLRSRWMLMISGTFAGFRKVRNAAAGRTIQVQHDHQHDHQHAVAVTNEHVDGDAQVHDHSHQGIGHQGPFEAGTISDESLLEVAAPTSARSTSGRSRWARSTQGRGRQGRGRQGRGSQDQDHSHGHTHRHGHSHQLALPDSPDVRYGNGTATGIGMLHGVGIESPTQIAIFVASTSAVGVEYGLVLLAVWVVGLIVANAVIAALVGAGLLHAEKRFIIYASLAVIVGVMSIALGMLYILGLEILPDILI